MAATGKIFGVKIILNDHTSPVVAASAIGLYNITSDLSGNAASAQKDVAVDDGTIFAANDVVTVTDDNDSETAIIDSIVGNTLTMKSNLTNAYTTAANALVNGNSVFRWVQNTVGGLTTWLGGIIVDKGIKAWTKSINLKRGGNIAQAGACQVNVNNTAKFWNTIKGKSIYFNGLRCEIYEIQHTYSGVGANQATLVRRWSGICQKPKWNTKQYSIPLVGFHSKRIANITKQVNLTDYPDADSSLLGNSIPATFGEIKPKFDANNNLVYNGYFKFIRTANKESTYFNWSLTVLNETLNITVGFYSGGSLDTFPIVDDDGDTPPIMYKIRIIDDSTKIQWREDGVLQTTGTLDLTYFEDKYLKVIGGTGEGDYRKISSAAVDLDTDAGLIEITVADYFENTLAGNLTATETLQSWIKIIGIARTYQIDIWPCTNYLDSDGTVLTQGANLYSYTSDSKVTVTGDAETTPVKSIPFSFLLLPQYAYEDSGDGNKNILTIDAKLFKNSPDTMDCFLIIPISSPSLYDAADLSDWGLTGYSREANGLYTKSGGGGSYFTLGTDTISGSLDNIIDKDFSSLWQRILSNTASGNSYWRHTFKFKLPSIPDNFFTDFGSYLLIKLGTSWGWDDFTSSTVGDSRINVYIKRFIGDNFLTFLKDGWEDDVDSQDPENYIKRFDNTPDFYYTDNKPSQNNKWFYWDNGDNATSFSGYMNIELTGVINKDIYNSLKQNCLLTIRRDMQLFANTFQDWIQLYEMAVAFKKSVSLKDAIYTPFQGRIFNDTWDSRFTVSDLIQSPRNIMEHIDRLKNWEDTSPPPSGGWGKGYATGALIKTGATTVEGSYDYAGPEFTVLDTYKASTQIQDYSKCYTDKIQTSICRDFFCASYYDQNGYANFKRIIKSETTPTDAVTLADIVDRSKIVITDPQPSDIFPEPFVKYRKNFATGEYEGIIRVTNVDAEAYVEGFIEGLSDSSAEELWNKCNTLWKKARHLEKPPSDMTDKMWFNGSDADSLAQDYIFNWVDWMFNPMCKFPVHYNKAGSWNEAHRFTLQLPHQTNDAVIECLTTGIKVDPNPPYHVMITAIMFSETIPEDFNYKDTYSSVSLEWKDNTTVFGNANDKKDNT